MMRPTDHPADCMRPGAECRMQPPSVVTAEAKSAVPAIGYAGTYAFGNVLLMVAGPLMLLLG